MIGLFVITRDDPLDDALAREAKRLGWSVLRLGLLATDPGPDRGRFLEWLEGPTPDAAIAWTSRRAAQALVEIALPGSRQALARVPLFALGEESAAPAKSAGLPVEVCPGARGAASLAEWIVRRDGDRRVARVAFLHGDKARSTLPDALRSAKIEVMPFELYRTRYLAPDVRELAAALREAQPVAVAFLSPSGMDALEQLLSPDEVATLRRDAEAVPRGDTTHQALASRGYGRARVPRTESRTFDAVALEALQSRQRTAR